MSERMVYIARESICGHATLAIVDNPAHAEDTSRELAKAIRQGMTIERMTVKAARAALMEYGSNYRHNAKGHCTKIAPDEVTR